MLKKFIILLFAPLVALAADDNYKIDKSHVAVGFLVEHVGYAKTLGMFLDVDGNFTHDIENNKINNVRITINTDSVFTNHDKRDQHLRSPDFLNSNKHPVMLFEANDISIKNDDTLIKGELTLLGIKKPLILTGRINKTAKYPFGGIIKPYVMGISARGVIKRSDHGMTYALKDELVGDDIEIIIEFEARRQ